MLNKLLLESIMKLHGDNGKTLSEALGMARSTFSGKLNEKRSGEFTQSEILCIKERYSLTPQQIDDIFFANVVS